jgi:hypothetical protein
MDQLIDLFYNQKSSYSKQLKFEVILLGAAISIFLLTYARQTYGFVILLFALIYFMGLNYVKLKNSEVTDFNKITMIKLQTLQDLSNKYILTLSKLGVSKKAIDKMLNDNKLDSLYIDANMISFLYSLIDLYKFNDKEFFMLLKHTNNILKIRRQIEEYIDANDGATPENIAEMFEISLQHKTKAINSVHNFIYSVPKINVMFKYIEEILERYSVLISRNTDIIHSYYKYHLKNTKINTMTKFVNYNTTKHFDIYENTPINVTKNKDLISKPLDFYL